MTCILYRPHLRFLGNKDVFFDFTNSKAYFRPNIDVSVGDIITLETLIPLHYRVSDITFTSKEFQDVMIKNIFVDGKIATRKGIIIADVTKMETLPDSIIPLGTKTNNISI